MGRQTRPTLSPQSLPEGAQAARLIVCERSGRWAVALRRELAAVEFRIHETRSLAECWEMLAKHPASFLMVELSRANAKPLLERLDRRERQFPAARVAVVADRSLGTYEWLIREAGVVHFLTSPRELGPMAGIACRHLDQVPQTRLSAAERIWASLPWDRGGQNDEGSREEDNGSSKPTWTT